MTDLDRVAAAVVPLPAGTVSPGRPPRFGEAERREVLARVAAGEAVKAVALAYGAPYATVLDLLHRHGVSPKATDDAKRLRQRERWRMRKRASRERSA